MPDVFVYDQLPTPLRVQIVYILHDSFGVSYNKYGHRTPGFDAYSEIIAVLCRHLGRMTLADGDRPEEILANFLLGEPIIESCIDAIEFSCRKMQSVCSRAYTQLAEASLSPEEAISDLNHRFLERGVGYQYVSGKVVRYDSQFLHAEVVKPALALLQDKAYQGANDEFLRAHEHYRKNEVKDCLADSLSALESTLKTICHKHRWTFQPKDTSKTLLEICFKNGLIPSFLLSHYSALQSTLESGVPTVRNKLGGHGQGPQVVNVPPHFAAYALHMTGSAIQFLIEAEKSVP